MTALKPPTPHQISQSLSVSGCLYLNKELHNDQYSASAQEPSAEWKRKSCATHRG